jgi:hypothetical protein
MEILNAAVEMIQFVVVVVGAFMLCAAITLASILLQHHKR